MKSLDYYLGDIDKSVRENIERKAQILGCIRIIDYKNYRLYYKTYGSTGMRTVHDKML